MQKALLCDAFCILLRSMDTLHFEYWPSIDALRREFSVPYGTANAWVTRGYIPASHDIQRAALIREKGGTPSFEQFHSERSRAAQQRRLKNGVPAR
jgi:hypothetical protein